MDTYPHTDHCLRADIPHGNGSWGKSPRDTSENSHPLTSADQTAPFRRSYDPAGMSPFKPSVSSSQLPATSSVMLIKGGNSPLTYMLRSLRPSL